MLFDPHVCFILKVWQCITRCCSSYAHTSTSLAQTETKTFLSLYSTLESMDGEPAVSQRDKRRLSLIVAMEHCSNGIGLDGGIPWSIPEDMQFFKRITTARACSSIVLNPCAKNGVIMGWRTWVSLQQKPLPDRINVVVCSASRHPVSSSVDAASGQKSTSDVKFVTSFSAALDILWADPLVDNVFAIGGSAIYAEALDCQFLTKVFISDVSLAGTEPCRFDTFFPSGKWEALRAAFVLSDSAHTTNKKKGYSVKFQHWALPA